MSAAGVELLVQLAGATRSVEIVHCSAPVQRLLSVCGLDTAAHGWSAEVPAGARSALGEMGLRD
jgi:hypothetical protein